MNDSAQKIAKKIGSTILEMGWVLFFLVIGLSTGLAASGVDPATIQGNPAGGLILVAIIAAVVRGGLGSIVSSIKNWKDEQDPEQKPAAVAKV